MNEPIPVKDALRLIEMALEDCDEATPGPWRCLEYGVIRGGPWQEYTNGKSDSQLACMTTPVHGDDPSAARDANAIFVVLARATLRPILEYLKGKLRTGFSPDIQIVESGTFHAEIMALYPPIAALRDHYDAVRPGWRDGK